MSWRTVVISSNAKLDYQMGYLVVRRDDIKKVYIDEISILIIENTAVSLTAALLSALTKKKVKVIFCDEKRNPSSELIPYVGSHNSSLKIRNQIKWSDTIKEAVWTVIVTDKIRKQAEFLQELHKPQAELLLSYIKDIQVGDVTNREGHAAKVYFNALFGLDFLRAEECAINAALNYGYGLLLSAFNREIVKNGYITQLGLWGIDIELTISRPVLMAIENQQLFSNVVQELYDQTGGEAGTFVLSEGEILYEIGKAAELIINPYAVDFNNRKFMKKIYSDLCDISITEKAMQLKIALTEMQAFIDKLCFDYPIALGCATEIKVGDLLKLYNVSVDARADNMAERLTNYIQLSSRLLGTKVFVLVNLRSYLMDSVILKIHETVQYENVALLLVESSFSADSSNMSVVIIDKDRCVINLKAPEKTLTPDQGDGFGEDLIF